MKKLSELIIDELGENTTSFYIGLSFRSTKDERYFSRLCTDAGATKKYVTRSRTIAYAREKLRKNVIIGDMFEIDYQKYTKPWIFLSGSFYDWHRGRKDGNKNFRGFDIGEIYIHRFANTAQNLLSAGAHGILCWDIGYEINEIGMPNLNIETLNLRTKRFLNGEIYITQVKHIPNRLHLLLKQ